ncbi:CoA-binding protein [Silicimonas sp. MF1-12-2]|uniref:CoA-binding protein n=1 Tax=Silicimonas sp. MF1-12-2 TaxID=3384793 RepID=UPI0039B6783F
MSIIPNDADLIRIIDEAKTIAIVGASNNPVKPSLFVATYFTSRGKRIIPINPSKAGESLNGETILADLSDIPSDTVVDMIDIFRRPEFVPAIVDQALDLFLPGLKTIWMQYGVRHEEAAAKARSAGLNVVQDKCPKVEHMRLCGAPNPFGLRGGVSSKLR